MGCSPCSFNALMAFAEQGAKDDDERLLVDILGEEVKSGLQFTKKKGGEIMDDIFELLGLKGDTAMQTLGGVAAEVYEDKVSAMVRPYLTSVPAQYTGAVAKLIPALVAAWGAKRQAGGFKSALEGASLNLRWAAYADIVRPILQKATAQSTT